MTQYRAIKVGNVQFNGCAFLAPLAGITDRSFRKLAERFGAASVTSEMVASASLVAGHSDMKRKLQRSGDLPHIVQLAGNEKEWLVHGAKIAADNGAQIIDFNLGCPSKRVTNGYAGSALMRVPDTALSLIEAVRKATPLPVTVKMRLGWNDDCLNAAQIAKQAESAGVEMFVVHARTRQQFYKGSARWPLVREIVESVSAPVLVNGDIVDAASARTALEQSGAAGVMCGRGAQGQPWIVGEINAHISADTPQTPQKRPQAHELLDFVEEHYTMMLDEYGTELGVRVARKHLDWYLQAAKIDLPKHIRKPILTQLDPHKTMLDLRNAVQEHVSLAA